MFSIYFPKAPLVEDFGLSNDEIQEIETFEIKPKRKGNRDDNLKICSGVLYYITVVFFAIYKFNDNPNGILPSFETILYCLVFPIMVCFTYIIPIIIFGFYYFILNLIAPKSIFPDKDVYDKHTLDMIEKKEKLKQYNQALREYRNKIEQIKKDFPLSENVYPFDMNEDDPHFRQLFKAYIKKVVTESFLQSFKDDVIKADKQDEIRSSEEWWAKLSPFDFEKEVGKWYERKGYHVEVTSKSNDGGVDIIMEMNGEKTYVQCKQWNYQVPVGVVRELFGVMSSQKVEKGIIVCLMGGTKGAVEFANDNGIRIVTHRDLVKEITPIDKTYTSNDFGTHWQYGRYSILYDAWKSVDDALETIKATNMASREFYVGLCKWGSFYLGIASTNEIYSTLSCVDYIIDAGNNTIIYEKTRVVSFPQASHGSHGNKKKRFIRQKCS